MLSRELRIRDIDPRHLANLWRLWHPPPVSARLEESAWGPLARLAKATARPAPASSSALSPRMPAIILVRGVRVLRAFQIGGGLLDASELRSLRQEDLRDFRRRQRLPFVAAIDVDALPALWSEAEKRVRLEDDYVAQQLAMARVLREALGKSVRVDPGIIGALPLPSYALLQTTLDAALPDGRSFVFYLAEAGQAWTSLIAVKERGDITLVTTHAAIADRVRFASARSDARAVLAAVAAHLAPPHIGIFLPLATWHELVAGDRSAVARALAARQAVLDPAPPWLLAIVGAGAMAEAASRSARLAGKLLGASRLGGAAERLVQTVANPLEALGVDPWDLLRWARDWARRVELDRERLQRGR